MTTKKAMYPVHPNLTSEFNFVDCLVQGLGCAYQGTDHQGRTSTGTWEQLYTLCLKKIVRYLG